MAVAHGVALVRSAHVAVGVDWVLSERSAGHFVLRADARPLKASLV